MDVQRSGRLPGHDDQVRLLCGQTRFVRAAWLQAHGHVLRPTLAAEGGGLEAEVRGTWRRIYSVRIQVGGGRLTPVCSCGDDGVCWHSGALLLHWVRAPETFEPAAQPPLVRDGHFVVTPSTELVLALERESLQRVRAIARRRGLRLRAQSKVEAASQLATLLAEPAGITAALADFPPARSRCGRPGSRSTPTVRVRDRMAVLAVVAGAVVLRWPARLEGRRGWL